MFQDVTTKHISLSSQHFRTFQILRMIFKMWFDFHYCFINWHQQSNIFRSNGKCIQYTNCPMRCYNKNPYLTQLLCTFQGPQHLPTLRIIDGNMDKKYCFLKHLKKWMNQAIDATYQHFIIHSASKNSILVESKIPEHNLRHLKAIRRHVHCGQSSVVCKSHYSCFLTKEEIVWN